MDPQQRRSLCNPSVGEAGQEGVARPLRCRNGERRLNTEAAVLTLPANLSR